MHGRTGVTTQTHALQLHMEPLAGINKT
uniref:Uncharacterized protein n=1 Tax=Anguilla anguilla TaxID=7936 RepID=A0A0E9S1S5_ANGAN